MLLIEDFYETLVNYHRTDVHNMELNRGARYLRATATHRVYVIESINLGMSLLCTFPIKLNSYKSINNP